VLLVNESIADNSVSGSGRPPTFLYIGGQRCASSWIHRCLLEHPQVMVTSPSEIHFFDRHHDRSPQWYFDHFRPEAHHRAWGEKTPAYLSEPDVAQRVRNLLPDIQFICCLREPIDRAYSLYEVRSMNKVHGTFEKALEDDPRLLQMGRYAEHLQRWFDLFPREKFLVLLYDGLEKDEAGFMQRVYSHLGVDDTFRPSWVGKRFNATVFPTLRLGLRRIGLDPLVRSMGRTPVGSILRRWHHRRTRGARKSISRDVRRRLQDYYEPSNRELERMLSVDLSAWRR